MTTEAITTFIHFENPDMAGMKEGIKTATPAAQTFESNPMDSCRLSITAQQKAFQATICKALSLLPITGLLLN